MFKVSEVAAKLNVDTYVIFDKLLNHKNLLLNYTKKVHSINYVDETGIEMIQMLIEGLDEETVLQKVQSKFRQIDLIEPLEGVENQTSDTEGSDTFESADEDDEWLTEKDFSDLDDEKARLHKEIRELRAKLIQYDSEFKRLDDAIINYQVLLREDMDYIVNLGKSLEKLAKAKIDLEYDAEDTSSQHSMFSFMRK